MSVGHFHTDLLALFGIDADEVLAYTLDADGTETTLTVTFAAAPPPDGVAAVVRKYRLLGLQLVEGDL